MQKTDSDAAQEFEAATKRGDYAAARKIYEDFKSRQGLASTLDSRTAGELTQAIQRGDTATAQRILTEQQKQKKTEDTTQKRSIFERTLSGNMPTAEIMLNDLRQFGYEAFMKTTATLVPSSNAPVGPDYIIGPGDQFTLTLWGTTEGIFSLRVAKEGTITLPKVGVVAVAGLRYGDLENTLHRHLSRYYSNFNLSVAMGTLRTITVYVVGEINSPGSYTVSSLTSAYGALFAAGGPTKKGTLRSIQVLRGGKVIKTLDIYDFLLKGDRSQDLRLQQEDTVFVPLIGPIAGVAGTVYRPAIYELKGNETINDLLRTAGGLMPIGLASTLQLTRYSNNEKKVILDIKVPASRIGDSGAEDMLRAKIQNMDVLSVRPVYDRVWETVNLQGDVRNPGDYQWRQDLKLKEIISEGQLLPTADLKKVEIIRLTDDFKDRKIIPVNLSKLIEGDESLNIPLMPKDQVRVYTLYREVEKVRVDGEVMSPGEYEIQKGERLSDILRRAGGYTREAYSYGAIFKRIDVKNSQEKNLQNFITRMQGQVLQTAAGSAVQAISPEEAAASKVELGLNQSLLENLKSMKEQYEGRVAINITDNIDEWAGTKDDLLLKNGDSVFFPKRPQEVLVMGEVHSPSAQVFVPGLKLKNYINLTGGYTNLAEEDQVYVLQANGFAYSGDSPSVGKIENVKLNAGDTVFVPQKMERNAGLRFFKDIIDIMFKTAVVLATINVLF